MCSNYLSSGFGVANILQRRAIVNGWIIGGKSRPVLVVSDSEVHNMSRYTSNILVVPLSHSRESEYHIPIWMNDHDKLSFIHAESAMFIPASGNEVLNIVPAETGFTIRSICPESAFKLVLRIIQSHINEEDNLEEAIKKYTLEFMEAHNIDILVWRGGRSKTYIHRDGTIDNKSSICKILVPRDIDESINNNDEVVSDEEILLPAEVTLETNQASMDEIVKPDIDLKSLNNEERDIIVGIYTMLNGNTLTKVTDRHLYDGSGNSFLFMKGNVYILESTLEVAMRIHLMKTCRVRKITNVMHKIGILDEDLDARTKKFAGKRHYVINYYLLREAYLHLSSYRHDESTNITTTNQTIINSDQEFDPNEKLDIVLRDGRFFIAEQSNIILLSFMRDIQKASRRQVADKYGFNQANFVKKYEMACYELINRDLGDFVVELPKAKGRPISTRGNKKRKYKKKNKTTRTSKARKVVTA